MSKLKKEHIDKIESLINISIPHKWVEHTVQISANRQGTITTGANIFTFDQETGLLVLHFELENRQGVFEPLDLTDVRHVILGYQFVGVDGGIIEHEPFIIDVEQGIVAMIMPNQYDFSGTVYCHTFIQYLDGRSFDAGLLQMQWTKSWLDMELPQLGQLEISRFTELIMQIHTMAGVAVGELQGQLDQIIPQINSALAEAQRIEDQINDNNIVRQNDFDELRESVEGIATEQIYTDTNFVTVEDSREGKIASVNVSGRSFVNLIDPHLFFDLGNPLDFEIHEDGSFTRRLREVTTGATSPWKHPVEQFKPNTTYTFVLDYIEQVQEVILLISSNHANDIFGTSNVISTTQLGRHIVTATTLNVFPENPIIRFNISIGGQPNTLREARFKLTIIEGDVRRLLTQDPHTLPRTITSSKPSLMRVTSLDNAIIESAPIEALINNTWQTPTLRSIQNGNQTLVADTIEEVDGQMVMVQRVGVVDLETVGISSLNLVEGTNFTLFELLTGDGFAIRDPNTDMVTTCNKLPTTGTNATIFGIGIISLSHISVRIPLEEGTTPAQIRNHFIDNDYEFLVPLAEPIIHSVRPIDLPSFEPVTHVHVDSGAVSPRTSFKIVTSIMPRLRKVENRLTNLENDFRNHIQTLARAIVQPVEKRDYKSVAMLGFPEEFEIKVEEQEVDVNAE